MVMRRFRDAGFPPNMLTYHTFRATTVADSLNQGVPLEDVLLLAGHVEDSSGRQEEAR